MTFSNNRPQPKPSHQVASEATWWLDFWSMAGRKSQNQDSLLAISCVMGEGWHKPAPLLVILADGVSACQFPKKASLIAVETVAETVINGLQSLAEQSAVLIANSITTSSELDDDDVAGIIKTAVITANDSMYFSQSYERVPPLLSTLSGLLCIDDRIHLFHTGDSRIYRMGGDSLTSISLDHRINHGQDKGALSAALGADTHIMLQQTVFTLHQHEYLVLMTDGVYEHIEPAEMQFDLSQALAQLESSLNKEEQRITQGRAAFDAFLYNWNACRQMCEQALGEGSNDNLSMIMIGMLPSHHLNEQSVENQNVTENKGTEDKGAENKDITLMGDNKVQTKDSTATKTIKTQEDSALPPRSANPLRYKLPTGLQVGDTLDGFTVIKIIARTARSEVYLVKDGDGYEYVLKSPSLNTVDDGNYLRDFLKERKIGLSLSKNRRAGESAYNQIDPNQPNVYHVKKDDVQIGAGLSDTGILRYYPVPASTTYLYHLTEYIDGESLRMFMERNSPCDVWQTHDLLTKIGMAVRVMHRNYLLHQDIKPENVLLTKNGAVKLIDFGSASSSILKDSTRPPVGDLHYAAPEYYTDAPKGVHSDLFSIAVIGFELLTGERPFTSQELMTPSQKLTVPTNLLRQRQVPFSSQQALIRGLHRNTNVRYQAIGEFLQEFNPDNMASVNDPDPLIKRNPLLVWHGICFIQFIVIILLIIKLLPIL